MNSFLPSNLWDKFFFLHLYIITIIALAVDTTTTNAVQMYLEKIFCVFETSLVLGIYVLCTTNVFPIFSIMGTFSAFIRRCLLSKWETYKKKEANTTDVEITTWWLRTGLGKMLFQWKRILKHIRLTLVSTKWKKAGKPEVNAANVFNIS